MENDNNKKFTPTTEWMEKNYNKLNQELFDGALGGCILRPFTSGKGSNGRTLGWFKITGNNIRVEKSTRKMFLSTMFGREYITPNNFVNFCRPAIELNANYVWTEKSMLSTLLHEMCHYYTYKNGYAPKQGHGPEFYAIGRKVSAKSNGLFPVERLASAEEMSEIEFSDDMINKINQNLKKNGGAYILFLTFVEPYRYSKTKIYKYGYVKIQTNKALDGWKDYIVCNESKYSKADIYTCDNIQEWAKLHKCNLGRYYLTNDIDEMISRLNAKKAEALIGNDEEETVEEPTEDNNIEQIIQTEEPQQEENDIIPIFRLKLGNNMAGKMVNNNNAFELRDTTKNEIRTRLKERFPKMSDETIEKLMNNPMNYPKNEGKILGKIVENTINNFLLKEFKIKDDDSVEIAPDMNLGLESPLEMSE